MSSDLKIVQSSSLIRVIPLLLGGWIFSFLFTLLMNEIITILVHIISGRPEFYLYLDLFEWAHTDYVNALPDAIRWNIGSFINIMISSLVFLILWKRRNQYLIPLFGWAPTTYVLLGYNILASNVSWTAWTPIVELGFPPYLSLFLGVILFLVGFWLLLIIRPLFIDASKTPVWKLMIINFTVIPFFQVINVLYSANFSLFGMIPILLTASYAFTLTVLEKPLNPIVRRITGTKTKSLKLAPIVFNVSLLCIIMMVFILSPYEPLTEKAVISNIITFSIIVSIFLMSIIIYLIRKSSLRSTKILIEIPEAEITLDQNSILQESKEIVFSEEIEETKMTNDDFLIEQQKAIENDMTTVKKEGFQVEEASKLDKMIEMEENLEEKAIPKVREIPPKQIVKEEVTPIEVSDIAEKTVIREEKGKISESEVKSPFAEVETELGQIDEVEEISSKKSVGDKLPSLQVEQAEEEDIIEEEPIIIEEIVMEEGETSEKKLVKDYESEAEVAEKITILPTGNLVCRYCGFNNPDDASYCLQCGQKIKK